MCPAFASHNHVVVVFMENHSYEGPPISTNGPVGNPAAPYYNNTLIKNYALIDNAYANGHDSLAQYFILLGGSHFCVTATPSFQCRGNPVTLNATAPNWVSSAINGGKTWKAYADGLPSRGYIVESGGIASVNPSGATYYPRHNVAIYYSDVRQGTAPTSSVNCTGRPVSTPGVVGYDPTIQACNVVNFASTTDGFAKDLANKALPNLSLIAPNGRHGAHDVANMGATDGADNWLATQIDPFLRSCYFTGNGCTADGMLIIWWDEGLVGGTSSASYNGTCSLVNSAGTSWEDARISSTQCGTFGTVTNGGGRVANIIAAPDLRTPGAHFSANTDLKHPDFTRFVLDELGLSTSGYPAAVTGGQVFSNIFAPPAVTTGSVSGTVFQADGVTPLAGAAVGTFAGGTLTATDGTYTLSNIPAGTNIALTAAKSGYVPQSALITIAAGQNTGKDFSLALIVTPEPPPLPGSITATGITVSGMTLGSTNVGCTQCPNPVGTISGQVTRNSDGTPILSAAVTIAASTAITDSSGNYSLSNITAGNITVAVAAAGFISQSAIVAVTAGVVNTQNFSLVAASGSGGGTITGTVTRLVGGTAISGATVSVPSGSTTTNGSGVYSLANVPAGTVTVTASASGFLTAGLTGVVVTDGNTTSGQDFALTACTSNCGFTSFVPNTTISEQRDNNTSACGSGGDASNAPSVGPTSCQSAFPGMRQNPYPITAISRSGSTVTVTLGSGATNFSTFDQVIISGVSNLTAFPNGTYQVVTPGSTTIKYTQAGTATSSSGGTATRNANTAIFNAAPRNVANFSNDGVDIHSLIYQTSGGTATTQIFNHVMPWFACTGTCLYTPKNPNPPGPGTTGGHVFTGYVSNNTNQVTAQVNHMKRLKTDGIIIDWYGPPFAASSTARKAEAATTDKFFSVIGAASDTFKFSVQLDSGMWKTSATCGATSSAATPTCVEKIISCAMDYLSKSTSFTCLGTGETLTGINYFGSSHYWNIDGHPVVGVFNSESSYFGNCGSPTTPTCAVYNNGTSGVTCTSSADCWVKVWAGVKRHTDLYTLTPYVYHRNTFSHSQPNNGSFKWLNPSNDQSYWDETALSGTSSGYESWLNTAKVSTLPVIIAGAWPGFDLGQSGFDHGTSNAHITDQQCGMVWMRSLGKANQFGAFSTSKQLPYMQLMTWNDNDEGTEIESGINSCYSISASINGPIISWTLATSNSAQAPLSPVNPTLHHYALYVTKNGTNAMKLGLDIPITATGSVNLSQFGLEAGTYTVYLKMVAQPAIQNSLSAAMTFVSAGAGGLISNVSSITNAAQTAKPPVYVNSGSNYDGNIEECISATERRARVGGIGTGGLGRISDVPFQELLYPGFVGKVDVHVVPWFTIRTGAVSCGSIGADQNYDNTGVSGAHTEIGFQSDGDTVINDEITMMQREGINAVNLLWHGPASTQLHNADIRWRDRIRLGFPTMEFSIMLGGPSWDACSDGLPSSPVGGCKCADGTTTTCAATCNGKTSRDISTGDPASDKTACWLGEHFAYLLNYINDNFVNVSGVANPTYAKMPARPTDVTPRPLVLMFNPELATDDNGSAIISASSTAFWSYVRSKETGNALYIQRQRSGLTYAQSNGAFGWQGSSNVSTGTVAAPTDPNTCSAETLGHADEPYGEDYQTDLFNTTNGMSSATGVGANTQYPTEVHKDKPNLVTLPIGFQNRLTPWGQSSQKMICRNYGLGILASIDQINQKFGGSKPQAKRIFIPTWNDYEEGSELETGQETNVTVSASVSGSTLSWTPGNVKCLTWTLGGSKCNVAYWDIWGTTDGTNLFKVERVTYGANTTNLGTSCTVSGSGTSLNLAACRFTPGTYFFRVEAVGGPGMLNKMSSTTGSSYVAP